MATADKRPPQDLEDAVEARETDSQSPRQIAETPVAPVKPQNNDATLFTRLGLQRPRIPKQTVAPGQAETSHSTPGRGDDIYNGLKTAVDGQKISPDLHVSYTQRSSSIPRVDIVAIHDLGETLDNAWIHRRKLKKRPNAPHPPLAGGGAGETASDRPSSDRGPERRVNWLSDTHMLPEEVPDARVMCYTYTYTDTNPTSNGSLKYLEDRAIDVLERLAHKRPSSETEYAGVPIILIGLGFGALIAQQVIVSLQRAELAEVADGLGPKLNTHVGIIAGVLLLDAPSPQTSDPDSFPLSRSQASKKQWTEDWLVSSDRTGGAYSETSSTPAKIDAFHLWNRFSRAASAKYICLSWHYDPAKNGDRTVTPMNKAVMLLERKSKTSFRLSRFEGPNDDDYKSLVTVIKRSILVKYCTTQSEVLTARFPDLSREKFPVDHQDQSGLTPLHFAVESGNYNAVRNLIFKGKALPTQTDYDGRRPLTTAILRAVGQGGVQIRYTFTPIIKLLAKLDPESGLQKNSPWRYATRAEHEWIRRLRKNLTEGNSLTQKFELKSVLAPEPGSTQAMACDAFDIFLVEVFLQKNSDGLKEMFNWDFSSVYDVIYNGNHGISRTLDKSRPQGFTKTKEQWVHDLLLSSGYQDGSTGGQRHEGTHIIDRYMTPQAKRYTYFHGFTDNKQPAERPKAVRRGSSPKRGNTITLGPGDISATENNLVSRVLNSSSSPEPKKLNAIVIFLPILGFEKHRHRKYLSRAISWATGEVPKPSKKGFTEATGSPPHAKSNESLLLEGYLSSPEVKPVHCRRTLDQFSYYMLKSTESRDVTQVAYRWARDSGACAKAKDRPVIMVDQLWLWVLDDGTVITSFPNTWNGDESFNLTKVLLAELRDNKERPLIRSVEHLLHLILKTSLDFCKREGPAGFRFEDCFLSSINSVSENQNRLFGEFCEITKKLEDEKISRKEKDDCMKALLRLDRETALLMEITDIQDELTIIKTVLAQQKAVLRNLLQLYLKTREENEDGEGDKADEPLRWSELRALMRDMVQEFKQDRTENRPLNANPYPAEKTVHPRNAPENAETIPSTARNASLQTGESVNTGAEWPAQWQGEQKGKEEKQGEVEPKPGGTSSRPEIPGTEKKKDVKRKTTTSLGGSENTAARKQQEPARKSAAPLTQSQGADTKKQKELLRNIDLMHGTLDVVEGHIQVTNHMLDMAQKVRGMLKSLLDLKQKQANGWEARSSREGSEETQRQGNVILFFTIVTAIFLPLSFMASFLALDIDVFPKDETSQQTSWPLNQVSRYLFGISAAIFSPLVLIALYVNELSAAIGEAYRCLRGQGSSGGSRKGMLGGTGEPPAAERDEDHDSDKENTSVEQGPPSRKSQRSDASHRTLSDSESSPPHEQSRAHNATPNVNAYARLFGTFTFHTKIPWLRRLWKIQRYSVRSSRSAGLSCWNDRYIPDYPLHHFFSGMGRSLSRISNDLLLYLELWNKKKEKLRPRRRRSSLSSDSYLSATEDESDTSIAWRPRSRSRSRSRSERYGSRRTSGSDYWYPARFDEDLAEASDRAAADQWSMQTRSRRSSRRAPSNRSGAVDRVGSVMKEVPPPSVTQEEGRPGRLRKMFTGRRKRIRSPDTEMGDRNSH